MRNKPIKLIKRISQNGVFTIEAFCLPDRIPENYCEPDLHDGCLPFCLTTVGIEKQEGIAIVVGAKDHDSAVQQIKRCLLADGIHDWQIEDCTDIPSISNIWNFENDRRIQEICSA